MAQSSGSSPSSAPSAMNGTMGKVEVDPPMVVSVKSLNFDYGVASGHEPILRDISFDLPEGSRMLLVGDNGAGKSTLLRILAGRHIFRDEESVRILGKHAFHDTSLNSVRAYLAGDWGRKTVAFTGHGCALQADIAVREMMAEIQAKYPERRDFLVELMGVDLDWRMHKLSDGQRRRVQIMLQLLRPSPLLLLDEITTDLDLITRQDFLDFLKRESEEKKVTIIYATHIFDGLDDWGTHLGCVADGRLTRFARIEEFEDFNRLKAANAVAPLFRTVALWLRADRDAKRARGEKVVERETGAVDELRGAYGNGYLPGRFNMGFA